MTYRYIISHPFPLGKPSPMEHGMCFYKSCNAMGSKVFIHGSEKNDMKIRMRKWIFCAMAQTALCTAFVLSCSLIIFTGFILFSNHAIASEEWLVFSQDKYSSGTKYYYNVESIQYFPDNRVSLWTKICSSSGEQFLHTEISCASSLFRIVQPPSRDIWDTIYEKGVNKTQYVVSGWYEIPPDSEVNTLRRFLCNNHRKN
jgi:hypothetical protein